MALSGFFGKRNISNLDLSIELPEEVYASKETVLKITLMNKKRFLPAFLIRVMIGDGHMLYPFIDPGKGISGYLRIKFPSRGIHKLEDVYMCSVFPFNFFRRCQSLELKKEVIVFPEPKEYSIEYEHELRRKRGDDQTEEKGFEGDLLSLRDYAPGDPLKYIHWKASAKTGRFKTKELSTLMSRPAMIDVERLRGRDLEERLSFATYLILRYLRLGLPMVVRVKGKVFYVPERSGLSRKEVLKELALY